MLKYIYDKAEDIPAELKKFYTEADGKWVLECEGAVPKARLDEFRKTNTELKKKLEGFEGIDPEEHKKLVAAKSKYEAAQADSKEKVEELVTKRVAALKEESDKKIADLTKTSEAQREKLHKLQIDAAVITAGNEIGLRKSAAQDLVSRARAIWKLGDNDAPVAWNGEEQIYGKGGQPITVKEWLEGLAKEAPHLFEESKGGGSGGSGGKGAGGGDTGENPWKDGPGFNLQKQANILKEDKEKARRLATAAGKVVKW